jgi:hypothetical protein
LEITVNNARFKFAVLACLVPFAIARGQTRIERHGVDPAPQETILPDTPVVVALERDFGWAVVSATINGQGPFRLVFDTGAPGLLLQKKVSDQLALPPPEGMGHADVQVRVAGPGGPGKEASLHTAASLRIGDAEFQRLRVIATELPMPSDIDGVLGMGVVSGCLTTLDYPAGKFRLERGELPPPDGRETVEFTQGHQRHSHPVIKVDLCGRPTDFIIDTGMSGWFRFTREVTEQCSIAQGPVAGPPAHSADRVLPTQAVRLAGNLGLAGYRFESPHGMIDDMELDPLVGGRALEHFAVAFDQRNHRVKFSRPDRSPIVPPAMRTLGFRPRRAEQGFIVWNLIPGSPAEAAGLKEGDLIISLNDRDAGEFNAASAWDALLEAQKVRVRYQRSGEREPKQADVGVVELLPELHAGTRPPQKENS